MDLPQTMKMTRAQMFAIGLPYGDECEDESKKAEILSDKIIGKHKYSTLHELIFRLPDMPDGLSYLTTYHEGMNGSGEEPWMYSDAVCKLVRSVERVMKVWEPVQG